MEIVSKILQAVLEIALPILVASGAGWMIGKCIEIFKKVRDKNPELYEIMVVISRKAVEAAEQIFGGGKGEEKKEYAKAVIKKYLAAKGIHLDLDIIEAYIESAVKELKDHGGELPPFDPVEDKK
jgi:LL-H family phage holin